MSARERFALNHMCAPEMRLAGFFKLANKLGAAGVEIRNDLAGNAVADGTGPEIVRSEAAAQSVPILSINALQRFNHWTPTRAGEARALIGYAVQCGAAALVLVPTNDGSGRANGERQANLRIALKELRPMLVDAGITGLVEPLGFESCSLRLKSEAADAIQSLDAARTFHLVHDTFHHHVGGEAAIFPKLTGLVHISGVSDPNISVREMRDSHRVLIDGRDRLDNIGQIAALRAGGYAGLLSFEPFAPEVHRHADIGAAIERSMQFINDASTRHAA